MKIPYGLIYLTSRVENGEVVKRYVGQHKLTCGVIEDGYLGSGTLLRYAIKKHGKECFSREILELCYSRKEMHDAEIYWIKHYDAVNSKEFYNIVDGGQNNSIVNNKPVHKYDLLGAYVSSYISVKEATLELRKEGIDIGSGNISSCANNRIHCNTAGGFQWSFIKDEKGIGAVERNDTRSRPVEKIDPQTKKPLDKYASLNDAARAVSCNVVNIFNAIKLGRKAMGCYWKYEDEELFIKEKFKKGRSVDKLDPHTLCVLETFDNSTIAGKSVGSHPSGIQASIANSGVCYGFRWKYSECEYGKNKFQPTSIAVVQINPVDSSKIRVFTNAVEAAKEMCCVSNSIRAAIKTGNKSKGFYWQYAD